MKQVDQSSLLKREDEGWQELVSAFEAVDVGRRDVEGVVPGWSTHDVVFHCVYWADYAGQVLERILAGDADPDDFDPPESEIVDAGRALSWHEVIDRAAGARSRVRSALMSFDDAPAKAIEWFQDDTFDHYIEHAAEITAFAGA
jgi:hypothetical protein